MTPAEDKTVSWDENHVRGMRKMSTDSPKYMRRLAKARLPNQSQPGVGERRPANHVAPEKERAICRGRSDLSTRVNVRA